MVDLNNDMSYVLGDIVHGYWPKKFVQFSVVLVPTVGAPSPDPDTIEQYGMNHALFYGLSHEPERSICLALHGKATTVIKTWVLGEWAKYKVSPATAETQLIPIFDYITLIGVKP